MLVYDHECPFCKNYCQMVRIKNITEEMVLVDARQKSELMDKVTGAGLDIDQGMVLVLDDVMYYGSDAIHMLSLISSRSGLFNRFNYWLFSYKPISKILYPLLRTCRNLALKVLGKEKINNLQIRDNSYF